MESEKTRSDPKDNDALLRLHGECVLGSDAAREEMASLLVFDLFNGLARKYARDMVDRDVMWDSVTAAVMAYCQNPRSYDPSSGVPLAAYLHQRADWNLRNALRAAQRRRLRESAAAEYHDGTAVADFQPADHTGPEAEWIEHARGALQRNDDRAVLDLWLRGEKRAEAFAKALDLSGCPPEIQRQQVKRAKDRILKTLQRNLRPR